VTPMCSSSQTRSSCLHRTASWLETVAVLSDQSAHRPA
jgi:hypothetical protein